MRRQGRFIILWVLTNILPTLHVMHGDWILPDERPPIDLVHAIHKASEYAESVSIDLSDHYIDRTWLGICHPEKIERCWVLSFASPSKGFLFFAVYMDGRVEVPSLEKLQIPSFPAVEKKNE